MKGKIGVEAALGNLFCGDSDGRWGTALTDLCPEEV